MEVECCGNGLGGGHRKGPKPLDYCTVGTCKSGPQNASRCGRAECGGISTPHDNGAVGHLCCGDKQPPLNSLNGGGPVATKRTGGGCSCKATAGSPDRQCHSTEKNVMKANCPEGLSNGKQISVSAGSSDTATSAELVSVSSLDQATSTEHVSVLSPDTATSAEHVSILSPDKATIAEHVSVLSPDKVTSAEQVSVLSPDTATSTEHLPGLIPDKETSTEHLPGLIQDKETSTEHLPGLIPDKQEAEFKEMQIHSPVQDAETKESQNIVLYYKFGF